jgi:multidrug efflux pump subunit AcrB
LMEFSSIVSINLAVSLLTALFFTPALYALLFSHHKKGNNSARKWTRLKVHIFKAYFKSLLFIMRFRKSFITLVVLMFGLPVFLLPSKWSGQEWYNKSIGSELYQEEIRPYSDKVLGGALRLFVRNVFEKSGYRTPEKTKLYVNAELPIGNTLEQMNFIISHFEDYLKTVEGVEKFITRVYSGEYANITIFFKEEYEDSSLPYQLKSHLIANSLDWGGVKWNVYGVGKGFSNASGDGLASFRVEMKGYNYDELEKQALVLRDKLLEHKRIQEVNVNEKLGYGEKKSNELVLNLNQDVVNLKMGNVSELLQALKVKAKPQYPAFHASLSGKLMPVMLSSEGAESYSRFDLMENPLQLNQELMVKLKDAATLELQPTSNSIHKEDRQYIRMVGFDYYGSHKFGNQYLDEVLEQLKSQMPVGYSAKKNSWSWNFETVKRQYSLLLILIIGIFFICSILFENFKQPIYIISVIPISFVGLFLVFAVFDFYFDQGGYAAFVMLGGLVVNAAIFIVNDYQNSRIKNNRSVVKAAAGKAQPILLTVLSTCFGLIPFLIDGQNEIFWFSLAIGTIGGLVFSLLAVFLFLPVVMLKRV